MALMMNLKLTTGYKSLRPFEKEFPGFSLITGVNGSGKSQLLEAIRIGKISVEPPVSEQDIRHFDWNSLGSTRPSQTTLANLFSLRNQVVTMLEETRKGVSFAPLLHDFRGDPWELLRLPEQKCLESIAGHTGGSPTEFVRTEMLKTCDDRYRNSPLWGLLGDHPRTKAAIDRIAKKHHGAILLLRSEDLEDEFLDLGAQDPFQNNLATIFLTYFEAKKLNRLRRMDGDDGDDTSHVRTLSDKQFEEEHGPPPWSVVNEALVEAGLDFQVDWPQGWTTTEFIPKLLKGEHHTPVSFTELSSGERLLMAMRLCAYNLDEKRQAATLPKILLLDEVDAVLHPSMSRRLVRILTDFVEKQGVQVFMTTHSATTVAVAPEKAVFLMGGKHTIESVIRQRAISALCVEIPALAMSFHGRRQVFVEDQNDAEIYTKLYELLACKLNSERTLTFSSAASRTPQGTHDGGCERVKRIVTELGADSVWGLVDWDGNNEAKSRVHVLAQGERYAIENCLFDPLVIIAALACRKREDWGTLPLSGFSDRRTDTAWLQTRVSETEELLELGDRGTTEVSYKDGLRLQISSQLLRMKGHDLERLIVKKFPAFTRNMNGGFHELKLHFVDPVLRDNIGLVPMAFVQAFQRLLRAPGDE